MDRPQKLGIMGGTFNPIHLAHLRVAEEARDALQLDEVVFIPAYKPPHKMSTDLAPFVHRLNMVALAVTDNPHFGVSDIEGRLGGISYTVRTIKKLKEKFYYSTIEIHYFIGADAFVEIETWWKYMELFELANMVVLTRPGHSIYEIRTFLLDKISNAYEWCEKTSSFSHSKLKKVFIIPVTNLDISASKIRTLLQEQKSARYLLPDKVRDYIERYKLYH